MSRILSIKQATGNQIRLWKNIATYSLIDGRLMLNEKWQAELKKRV